MDHFSQPFFKEISKMFDVHSFVKVDIQSYIVEHRNNFYNMKSFNRRLNIIVTKMLLLGMLFLIWLDRAVTCGSIQLPAALSSPLDRAFLPD